MMKIHYLLNVFMVMLSLYKKWFFLLIRIFTEEILAHLFPIDPFSTSWKHQKTARFSDVLKGAEKGCIGYKWIKVSITCRALLETGPRYFPALLEKLNIQPVWKETKRIKLMIYPIATKIDVFEVEIEDLSESLQF